MNILMVDDEAGIHRTYGRLLADEGHRIFPAYNATQAVNIMITRRIDLVLLDINIPDLDGSAIREIIDEYDEALRVIVFSVYPLEQQKQRIPRATGYFDKSQDVGTLLDMIRDLPGPAELKATAAE